MYRLASMIATAALLFSADASGVLRVLPPTPLVVPSTPESLPETQAAHPSDDQGKSTAANSTGSSEAPGKARSGTLQPASRLSLVRYVDGEIVQVVRAIPAGKKGFHMKAGAPFNETALRMAVSSAGSAINPGDRAQITSLDFKEKEVVVDINGGGKGKTRLRDRIHLEVGGAPTMTTMPNTPVNTSAGATIYLDFDKALPDM